MYFSHLPLHPILPFFFQNHFDHSLCLECLLISRCTKRENCSRGMVVHSFVKKCKQYVKGGTKHTTFVLPVQMASPLLLQQPK